MRVLMRQGLEGRVPKRAAGEKRYGGESRNPEKPGFCDAIAKSRPEKNGQHRSGFDAHNTHRKNFCAAGDCMFGENEVYNIRWL